MDTIEIEGAKWRESKTHISKVSHGDTILHDGQVKTLTSKWIKRNTFVGDTIWGDSYFMGSIPVRVITKITDK